MIMKKYENEAFRTNVLELSGISLAVGYLFRFSGHIFDPSLQYVT